MPRYPYERPMVQDVLNGMGMKKRLLHIIIGPRQVGKTTAALQIAKKWKGPIVNASADLPLPPGPEWLRAQWDRALQLIPREGTAVPLKKKRKIF